MATEILLPKQGNSVESCIILEWKKNEGDPVASGEPILEVETDKATMEVESTADGVLLARLVQEGDDVEVLTPIAVVGEEGEAIPATSAGPSSAAAETEPGSGVAARAPLEPTGSREVRRDGRIAISPRARKLAEARSIDYSGIRGTGPGGRIMVRDVEASGLATAASAGGDGATAMVSQTRPAAAARALETPGGTEDIPVTGIRKIIANRMLASLNTTAQFTMNTGADARKLLGLRKRLKTDPRPEFQAVSINDLVMFAAGRTLRRFPGLNATFADGVIRRHGEIHLGFAVDTDRGLMVPVVRNTETLSLVGLAAEAHRLAEACKASKATPDDLEGATFSVTNLGVYGIESFTPVLDAPQVAILGVGTTRLEPTMVDGAVEFVPTIGLSLTIDHQVVDGAPGARFLQALSQAIADIDLTLAE
jgi:pyruvate dehydrogenase E2 component (dihydrolipoamide acetyltransferase)